jgi:murein DD-endopeptidase MepM/ murein hydrolase activator NlpD
VIAPLLATVAFAAPFSFQPPGELLPGSGTGRPDYNVYAPGIQFPIQGEAFLNSQVYNPGGMNGGAGGQCAASNRQYPWRDTYCESRQWEMPLCPAGTGHQGVDIRGATCADAKDAVVAVTDGVITHIGTFTLYLTDTNGTRYEYLHMKNLQVQKGQSVTRGQLLGYVSNIFSGRKPGTTYHLHFNVRQNLAGQGLVYVPPYLSLIQAYEAIGGPSDAAVAGTFQVSCDRASGWAFDADDPNATPAIHVQVDGQDIATGTATVARTGDCATFNACGRGFELPLTHTWDGQVHAVQVFAVDAGDGSLDPLGDAVQLTCAAPVVDPGPPPGGTGSGSSTSGSSAVTPKPAGGCCGGGAGLGVLLLAGPLLRRRKR